MRPTNELLILLLLGLLPMLYALWTAWRRNWQELMRLRVVAVVFFWIGFHFGPWYTYLTGKLWDDYLFVPRFMNDGLIFSTLCMAALLVGYDWMESRRAPLRGINRWREVDLPTIKPMWLLGVSFLSLVMFVITVGGWDEVWRASYTREEYQWIERNDLADKLKHMVRSFGHLVGAVLAAMTTAFVLQESMIRPGGRQPLLPWGRYLGGIACLVVASLGQVHYFSRAAGFAFLIFAFFAPRFRGHRALPIAAAAFFVAVYLGSVGLYGRQDFKPGLGNYLEAVVNPPRSETRTVSERKVFFLEGSNPIDGMAAWTRKADAAVWERPGMFSAGAIFFWNLNPLPSEIVPMIPMGKSLSEIMGTEGRYGLSMPALAELYYPFGHAGCLLFIPLGALYCWFERLVDRKPGVISLVCLLLCFLSVPLGVQHNARTMTRPVLYALVIYWAATFVLERCRSRVPVREHAVRPRQLVPHAPGERGA